MPTITRTQTLENCPFCEMGKLTIKLIESEPFPEERDAPKSIESKVCSFCSYELVTKDELTGRETPYIINRF